MNNIIEKLLKKIKKIYDCVLPVVKSRAGLLVIAFFVLLLIVSLIIGSCVSGNREEVTILESESATETITPESSEATEKITDTETETEPPVEKGKAIDNMEIPDTSWAYYLINRSNPISDNFEETLKLDYVYSNGSKYFLDERITDFTEAMINDAYDDGVTLLICSAYRDLSRQTTNFENRLRSYANARYNFATAYKLTAGYIAVPGTSEHHTGLAIDFVTPGYMYLDSGFEYTDAYKWLSENSYKYGFILRYPDDTSELTGINYEPWHFRFIGFEHAEKIYESGLCLEEYMEREKENYPDVQFNILSELLIPSEPLWYNIIKNAPETESETESDSESDSESLDSDSEDTSVDTETEEDFPDWLKPDDYESDTLESEPQESEFDYSDFDVDEEFFEETDFTDTDTDSDTYSETDTGELTESETVNDVESEETDTQETSETEFVTESEAETETESESLDEEEV